MKRQAGARIFSVALTLLLTVSIAVPRFATARAETPKEKLDRITAALQVTKSEIAKSEKDIQKAAATQQAYAEKAELERQALEILTQQIADAESALQIKQDEIAAKIADIEHNKALFETRIVTIYENKDRSGLATLLAVQDFSELLRVSEDLQAIAKHDTELIALLHTQQIELEALAVQMQTQLDALNAQKAESERLKAEYEHSMLQAKQAKDAAEAKKASAEITKEQQTAAQAAAMREWEAWVAKDTQGGAFVGGVFAWPLPGRYSVSSGFGERADNHRGIDIPAPIGTAIYAAADGTVSTAAHSSYGVCVKLSHGGGVVSVYGHMSARAAGIVDGAVVSKGQLLGYVGLTGVTTGPHLHFEVDVNGGAVNPYTYLQG